MIGVFVAALLALSCACRGGTVEIIAPSDEESGGGIGQLRGDGAKRPVTSGIRGSGSAGEEDDTSDFPQEIAGSFLTCARSDSPDSAKNNLYGCRVERQSLVVNIEKFSPAWSLEEGGLEVEGSIGVHAFRALPVGSTWHVEVNLPEGRFKNPRVRVKLDFGDGQKGSLSRSLSEARPFLTMAQSKIWHVGDREFLMPLLANCGMQVSGASSVDKVLKFKLTIEGSKTAASLSLGGLCGVDYTNNSVTIKSSKGDTVAKGELRPGAKLFNLPTPVLEPGSYQVDVASSQGNFGYDDFLIGEVMATVTDPKAKIKLEPMAP